MSFNILASLSKGDTIVHLGCGDGASTNLLMRKVVEEGYVVGLDISEESISKARRNAKSKNLIPPHVAFVRTSAWTDEIPVASDSARGVISSGITDHLSIEGKRHVLKEVYRILKPSGRVFWAQGFETDVYGFEQLLMEAGFETLDYEVYSKSSSESSSQVVAARSNLDTPLLRWWDAYPVVRTISVPRITADVLASYMTDRSKVGTDYAVIDVRRDDHGGGHVRGSHQWPAQTFYNTLAMFYEEFGKTKEVIFYCGSSNGRGPRCAGWYQDYLDDIQENGQQVFSKAVVLEGGVKQWLATFGGDKALVERDKSIKELSGRKPGIFFNRYPSLNFTFLQTLKRKVGLL